ncbi:MAG: metal-dependent transcriptional regulator, partial [Actinomycetia bacterium]|nr:metal-dependent transcriptional regulator [Actinomycetes bacterium]
MATAQPIADGTASTSESEQMYLITIAMAAEEGHEGPVPVPRLAQALEVSRVSANEMVKKLAERGLVAYTPYKGADLTAEGAVIART